MEAVFDYVIGWKEICRTVDKYLVDKLNNQLEEIKVIVKLSSSKDVELNHCIIYWEDAFVSKIDELGSIEDKVFELKKTFEEIQKDFKDKTDVGFSSCLFYDGINSGSYNIEDCVTFTLDWENMVQLTPQAKKMKDNGIRFDLESWIEGDA